MGWSLGAEPRSSPSVWRPAPSASPGRRTGPEEEEEQEEEDEEQEGEEEEQEEEEDQ